MGYVFEGVAAVTMKRFDYEVQGWFCAAFGCGIRFESDEGFIRKRLRAAGV